MLPAARLARHGLGARARMDGSPRARAAGSASSTAVHHPAPRPGRAARTTRRSSGRRWPPTSLRAGWTTSRPLHVTLATWRPWRRTPPVARRDRRSAPAADGSRRRLLVDHWYSHAVGHVIEALRRCQGYHACDPTLRPRARPERRVARSSSPAARRSSTRSSPSRTRRSAAPRAIRAGRSAAIPRDWDYVVHHPAVGRPRTSARFDGLRRYYEAARRHFRARIAVGARGSAAPGLRAPPAPQARAAGRGAGPRADGARRSPVDRRDAGRERRSPALPVGRLVGERSSTARAAVPGRRLHVRRAGASRMAAAP